MSVWDSYQDRLTVHGNTRREISINGEIAMLQRKLINSPSYHSAEIEGEDRNVVITDSDNYNEKTIYSMPGEQLLCGSMVYWMNNWWLVTETDANTQIRTKGKMIQCNYLLRWVTDEYKVREQWCVVEDGTKLGFHDPCLAYWKRYVTTTSRIAGTPLEPWWLQREDETRLGVIAKRHCGLGNQQPSPTREGSTIRPKAVVGASAPKREGLSRYAIWTRYDLYCGESRRCA